MITTLRKAQDSWITKGILILTAMSFMSLFGISGYIDSAAGNRAVIKVNDREINQQEINLQLNDEIRTAQKLFGDLEITDEIRNNMLAGLVERDLEELIVAETAARNKISVSDRQIRGIVFSQPQFMDAGGQFNREVFNYFLSQSGMSESEYLESIKSDLERLYLAGNPTAGFNVPSIMKKYVAAAEAERKIFKYIEIDDADMVVDREISDDESRQYYEDFASEFVVPETRDADFVVLSFDDIAENIDVSDEEITAYYEANINRFVTPETRNVLQMVFDDEKKAEAALAALQKGEDFYQTARDMAGQIDEETNLEYVSEDMLLGDLGGAVFAAAKNEVVGPVQTEMGWHIMKVTDIKAGSKTDESKVKGEIRDAIAAEKVYETAYDLINDIEDSLAAGGTLADIAEKMNVNVNEVKGLDERGNASALPAAFADLMKNADFIDTVFSYNQGEISQVVETDDGYVFAEVKAVADSRPQSMEEALPEIKKIWRENEKSAIAQEIVNDVMHDLENGDNIADVGRRFRLKIIATEPLSRSESFAGLAQAQMLELFNDANGTPKLIEENGKHIIAVADGQAAPRELSETDMEILERRLQLDLGQEAEDALIKSYGQDYDVRVKYRLLGLAD